MGEVIKAYKGFNKDMTCRDFRYEEGKEYEEERAEACNCGFHACEHPLDCLVYYDPAHSVYHEVEQSGEISKRSDDTKVASTKIKIGARVSIAGLVQAAIEYTKERVKPEAMAKGVKGSTLVLAEWKRIDNDAWYWKEETWDFIGSLMVRVDGGKVKENTWYTLKNGELMEVEDE